MKRHVARGVRVAIALLVLAWATSLFRHWSGGIRIGEQEFRLEAQSGALAFAFWSGNSNFRLDLPLFWSQPIDRRTRLVDASRWSFAGFGLAANPGYREYSLGLWSGGVVVPSWFCVLAMVLLAVWSRSHSGRLDGGGSEGGGESLE